MRGDLSQRLQEVIITEELVQLAPKDSKEIMIEVTISEDEFRQAQNCLNEVHVYKEEGEETNTGM